LKINRLGIIFSETKANKCGFAPKLVQFSLGMQPQQPPPRVFPPAAPQAASCKVPGSTVLAAKGQLFLP
jgi:hypothetical protein